MTSRVALNTMKYQLEGAIAARIQLCEEMNAFLSANQSGSGIFNCIGLVRWWNLNKLLRAWIVENGKLIEKHARMLNQSSASSDAIAWLAHK